MNTRVGWGIFVLFLLAFLGWFFADWPTHEKAVALPASVPEEVPLVSDAAATATVPVSILAFGDLMLDREVRREIERNSPTYPFEKITEFLKGHDIVVANAEGPFFEDPVRAVPYALPQFGFKKDYLPVLRDLGFTVLSQANNHSYDHGPNGLASSTAFIRAAGIGAFGDYENLDPGPYVVDVRGEKIAFIGYHQFTYSAGKVFDAIKSARAEGAFVIVYPHWGVEYSPEVSDIQRERAHGFIDAGADLVLGSHPHVIQPIEVYKGKAIFYSMGNFIFDQIADQATREGLAVEAIIATSTVTYTLHPFEIIQEQASLMSIEGKRALLTRILGISQVDESVQRSIQTGGSFTLPR